MSRAKWRRKYSRRARYPGVCSICEGPIAAQELIAWAPGRPPDHWTCYVPAPRTDSYIPSPGSGRWTTGSGERGLSDQARDDLAAIRRGHESYERAKADT